LQGPARLGISQGPFVLSLPFYCRTSPTECKERFPLPGKPGACPGILAAPPQTNARDSHSARLNSGPKRTCLGSFPLWASSMVWERNAPSRACVALLLLAAPMRYTCVAPQHSGAPHQGGGFQVNPYDGQIGDSGRTTGSSGTVESGSTGVMLLAQSGKSPLHDRFGRARFGRAMAAGRNFCRNFDYYETYRVCKASISRARLLECRGSSRGGGRLREQCDFTPDETPRLQMRMGESPCQTKPIRESVKCAV
jgi:hypothetical protein